MADKLKPYFNVVKNEASREATIYLYGVIGGIDFNTWEEINTANLFANEFREVEKDADTIHVRINTPGGSVFEGLAIYNTLINSDKKIVTYNDGLCASMGALILLAGDEIHAFPNSLLMIHNSSNGYWGNKKEVEEQLQASDKIDKALGTAIEERLEISSEEVAKDYLNYTDNWYNADEAIEIGFYDVIIEKKKAQVPENVQNMNTSQRFEQYAAMTFKIPTQKIKTTNTMSKKPASFPRLEAALGLSAPLATNDNGSYINETQKETIDNHIAGLETNVQNATQAKEQAVTDLQAEKDGRQAAIDAETANTTTAVTAMRTAATLAGVEDLPVDASLEVINTALTAKIEVLNGKPGAKHTAGAAKDEETSAHPYVDYNNSIYSQINK